MSAVQQYDQDTGEVIQNLTSDTTVAVAMARAEIDQAIATARAYPRNVSRAVNAIMQMTMLDEESAAECVYALPRGGKPIKGPSVRFAEIVAAMYGNCHVASRVVAVDKIDKVVIAEGVFLDLETGFKRMAQVRRRITDKNGRLYNDDMIVVTGNAAASIAMREAVLKGIPKAVWRKAYERAEQVISGDVKTLVERRGKAVAAFATYGVTPERVCKALEIESVDEIDLDRIGTLTAMFKSIRSGEMPVEEYFPAEGAAPATGKVKTLEDVAAQAKPEEDAASKPDEAKAEVEVEAEAEDPEVAADDTSQDSDADANAATDGEEAAGMTQAEASQESRADAFQKGEVAGKRGRRVDSAPAAIKGDSILFKEWSDGWAKGQADATAS